MFITYNTVLLFISISPMATANETINIVIACANCVNNELLAENIVTKLGFRECPNRVGQFLPNISGTGVKF